jgi:hypothetical protein
MSRFILGLVALLVVASCAKTPAESTKSTSEANPSPDAAEWMADLCATATDLRTGLWASAKDTGPLRQRLRGQLDTAAGAVDTSLAELAAMATAPVDGGDEAVAQLSDELTDLRNALIGGHDDLDALPANAGDEALGRVLGNVWPAAAARAADPFAGVTVSAPMLDAAVASDCAPFFF